MTTAPISSPDQVSDQVNDQVVHDAIVVANSPEQLPVVFDVTAEAIATMQAHAATLAIVGPEDKAGFTAVYNYRQMIRRQRLDVSRRKDELRNPHTAYVRQVDSVAASLIDPMKAIEKQLSKQEDAYEEERKQIAHEKAMFIQNRTEGRVNELRTLGFVWCDSDDTYTLFGVDELDILMEINFDYIKDLADEEYAPTFQLASEAAKTEQDRLAEVQRLKDVETARIEAAQKIEQEQQAAAQQAERNRLAEIDRQQQIERDRLAAAAQQLEEAEKRMQLMEQKARLMIRTPKMVGMGFVEEEAAFVHPNTEVQKSYIAGLSDEEFDECLVKLADGNRQWEEQQRWNTRCGAMISAGFTEQGRHFEQLDFVITKLEVSALTDEAFAGLIDDAAKRIKQADADKKKADKARQTRLAPDKKKLATYFATAGELIDPKLTQPETIEVKQRFDEFLATTVNQYLALLESL